MQKETILKKYIEKDPRLSHLIYLVKPYYERANLPNHNLDHIAQVLYRALLITETDNISCNKSVLIATVLLHDIGYTVVRRKHGHEETGREISKTLLEKAGFTPEEINKIIDSFLNYLIPNKNIEGDILFDADVLNMAGYGSAYYLYVSLYEYRQFPETKEELYEIDKHLESRIKIMQKLKEMDLRTPTGKSMLKDGYEERIDMLKKGLQGLRDRPDLLIKAVEIFG